MECHRRFERIYVEIWRGTEFSRDQAAAGELERREFVIITPHHSSVYRASYGSSTIALKTNKVILLLTFSQDEYFPFDKVCESDELLVAVDALIV